MNLNEIEKPTKQIKNNKPLSTKRTRQERNRIDSLRECNAFEYSINLAKMNDDLFRTSDTLEINIFKAKGKYVFIRFQSSFQRTKIGLFKIKPNQVETIFQESFDTGYSTDTVYDVNGDRYPDVLTSFYAPSGCCLRDLVSVRLFNPNKDKFEDKIELMNPTFLPNEKLILGINYGHSGITPLYKYKWENFDIKTVEFIYPMKESKKEYLLVNEETDFSKKLALENSKYIISELPEEYSQMESLDWFLYYQTN